MCGVLYGTCKTCAEQNIYVRKLNKAKEGLGGSEVHYTHNDGTAPSSLACSGATLFRGGARGKVTGSLRTKGFNPRQNCMEILFRNFNSLWVALVVHSWRVQNGMGPSCCCKLSTWFYIIFLITCWSHQCFSKWGHISVALFMDVPCKKITSPLLI